jgi:predicted transcriptional regulator
MPTRTDACLTAPRVWPYACRMAIQTIKSTYALDVETVRTLDRLAERWRVTKSEALRRAIQASAASAAAESTGEALRALDRLQATLKLDVGATREWARSARQERKASSTRRTRRAL